MRFVWQSFQTCGTAPIAMGKFASFSIISNLLLNVALSDHQIQLVEAAKASEKLPKIHITGFDHLPRKYTYFDDSSVILYLDEHSGTVHRSADDGVSWQAIDSVGENLASNLIFHPFDKKAAFILGTEKLHYRTKDQGTTWQAFHTEVPPSLLQSPLSFNAQAHDSILFAGERCDDKGGFWGTHCYDHTYYTESSFEQSPKLLRQNTHSCIFARSTKNFKESSSKLVLCIDEDRESNRKFPMNLRLVATENWFKTESEVLGEDGPLRGVVGLGAVQTFIVAATKRPGTDEMALYVTDDGTNWDMAQFPHDQSGLKEDAYTILESRSYAIQVDVMSSEIQYNSFGALFTSNSNGTYFSRVLEHTNRNEMGIVDFENIENVEGIVLANTVANHLDVQKHRNQAKKLQSQISFNDGRDWQPLAAPKDADCHTDDSRSCTLHLYSAAAPHNVGRILSSTTPGILMGVGNVGSELLPYADCDLYVSEDAGVTWRMSKKEAHKYEWGDQGSVLVAVFDEDSTDKIYYSFNRGVDWQHIDLGMKVRARILTTVPDSTSEKFTLVASRGTGEESDSNVFVVSIDFTGIRSRKCKLSEHDMKNSDFEKWYARYDSEGNPGCLMGHKQFFWRKKPDRECYVGEAYHDPEPKEEDCPCSDEDFECDYNYIRAGEKCIPAQKIPISEEKCKNGEKTFKGPSGYRLIPGNTCDRKKGLKKDDEIQHNCSDDQKTPSSGQIAVNITEFSGHARQYFYLERSEVAAGTDETVVMQIDAETVYKSHNHGASWTRILEDEDIIAIIPHKYFADWVYFLTPSRKAFLTKDRAKTVHEITMPTPPNNLRKPILDFHSTKSSWLLFTGMKGCERLSTDKCRAVTYYTEDGGSSWDVLRDYVDNCQYIGTTKVESNANLIYCAAWSENTDHPGDLELFSSVDYFGSSVRLFESIVGFAVFEEFVVVAEVFEATYLRMHASIDGETFAHGHFPPKFNVDHQQAYTVLDSVTKSIFLHVSTNSQAGREWGSILKSNSNGTYFVTSIDFVNRNTAGYVDFEKLMGLEGVAIINIVGNVEEVQKGAKKQLRTMMTHNDGGQWLYLTPPKLNSEGKPYQCSGPLSTCSLNLHGYTERVDVRDTYSSGSAIGILLGVGSVGESLAEYEESNTYMSNDGGITWHESHNGPYQWEYGDQGSVVVIVKDGQPTDRVLYTLDEGRTWNDYIFAEEKLYIRDITTTPSDTSRGFLLFAKPDDESDHMKTISIDFSGLSDRQCQDPFQPVVASADISLGTESNTGAEQGDFYLWTPSHPSNEEKCLFGHVAEYHRKKPDSLCYIGAKSNVLHGILQNCSCSIYDFECDYNYQRASDGTCQLISGLQPPDHSEVCSQKDTISWTEPTGYRRIPLTTCEGGKKFDEGKSHACPGHETEFRDSDNGLRGFSLFLVICLPFVLASGIGYYIWKANGHRTLGQIRLGDDTFDDSFSSSRDQIWQYGATVLSGCATAISAVFAVLHSGWKFVRARAGRDQSSAAYYRALGDDASILSEDNDALDEDI